MNNIENLLGFSNIICGLISIFLALLVLIRKKYKQKIHIGTGILAISAAIYCLLTGLMFINLSNISARLFFHKLTWFGATLCASSIILYSYFIFEKNLSIKQIICIYLPTVFFGIIAFTEYGVKEVSNLIPLIRKEGIFANILHIYLLIVILSSYFIVIKNYKNLKGIRRLQIQYSIIGFFISVFSAAILGVILPLTGISYFIPLAPSMSIIWIFMSTYSSVYEDRLSGVELLKYDIFKFLVLIIIFLSLNCILLKLLKHFFNFNELVSSSLSLIIIGFICFVAPLRNTIDNTLKNIFLAKRISYTKLLEECTYALTSILDINELLEYIVKTINKALNTNKIGIFLKEGDRFRLVASHGLEKVDTIYLENQQLIRWLNKNRAPFVLDTAWQKFSSSEYDKIVKDLGMFGAILVIPLIYKGEVKGVMTLDQKKTDGMIFDIDDIEILNNLGNELAIAIENAELYKRLDDAYMNITRALSIAVEQKEGYTVGHSDNVTKYALLIAKKMGLSQKEIIDITQAAMLHDIGKIGIKDSILSKPGKLNEEEWREMRQHSEKGAKILSPLHMISVSEIVTHHHERYDGKGYPEGLKGDEIPLGAQILCVADSFDAMVTERPYRDKETKRLTIDEAVEELVKNKGTQFNPKIVDTFIEIIKENPNIFSKKEK